jgi:anti-sigma factor RsiW
MNFSDETLMAYADGELGEPERSAVAQAEREDPAVAAIIARHRKLHTDVYAAFAGVLDEPVPARLQVPGADTASGGATVASLAAARERKAKARESANAASAAAVQQRSWPRWGALAASLAVGVLAGSLWLGGGTGGANGGLIVADGSGRLVAKGELASALSQQLASTAEVDNRVQIGVSFAAKGGGYCRSFAVGASAGLACRDGDTWRVPVLQEAPTGASEYRQAGSAAPVAVLDAIDQRIEGAALDAAAERAARDRGWKR